MEFDRNNCWWLSYPNGIQRFDGKKFVFVPVQPGLPENKYCRFLKCNDGTLIVSHFQGISKYDDKGDKFNLVYKYKEAATTSSEFIGESDGVIYFYTDAAEIIGINTGSFIFHSSFKTGLPDYKKDFSYSPKISDNIIGGKTAMIINKKIYTWDLKKGEFLYQSATFPEISSYMLRQMNESEILFYNYNPKGTLQILNTVSNTNRPVPIDGLQQVQLGRCVLYNWQNKILLSINNRIYETDASLQKLKSEIVNYQNVSPAGNATVHNLIQDNFGNLFALTVTGGIRKITANNYPLKYYNNGNAGQNFIISIFADKENNRVLAGAYSNGLFVYDTLQQLIKHIPMPVSAGKFHSPNAIIKSKTQDYFIFTHGSKGVWKLNRNLEKSKFIPLTTNLPAEKSGVGYFCKLLYQDSEKAVVLSETKIYRLDFASSKVYEYPSANGYIMSGVYSKPYFIMHYNDEIIFMDENNFSIIKRTSFKNTGGIRCYLNDGAGKIYAGTNKGVFVTDTTGKILKKLNKETGMPDECIYAMAFDKNGHIWCSTNKGILKIAEGRVLQQIMKQDGLQENEFNTNVVTQTPDGELFFGGINGFNSFYPSAIGTEKDSIHLLMTAVMANNEKAIPDTADWNIANLRLPYDRNALSFDFAAMGNHNPDQYIYQYRMDGVDKQWIQSDNMQTVRYSLAPGKYTFKIFASRSFEKDAKPMKEIWIIVQPPFWKSWWFLTSLGILFISLLTFGINQRNERKYAKKLQQLENERQIKLERERISKDLHDSLGAYANAVLYNTELLEKEKTDTKREELIGDLKFASKDIITALRETVWALKKEEYTAEECLLRIRNFIQPFAKYYSHIQFLVTGEAPAGLKLHYTKALNLVRIVQEAVSNSIKHAAPTLITINTLPDQANWKLEVKDNGQGFNYDTLNELERGNGLSNMEHRATESGFAFEITSNAENGTKITIQV